MKRRGSASTKSTVDVAPGATRSDSLFASGISRMWDGWNRFWFTPSDCMTLAVLRILTGLMLFYTHLVWGLQLSQFLGPAGRLSLQQYRLYYASATYPQGNPFAWSHLPLVEQTSWLPWVHALGLVVFALLTLGLWTRITATLAFLLTVSYSHRLVAAQFGLDQINAALALYLAVGPSGAVLSLDAWRRGRRAGQGRAGDPGAGDPGAGDPGAGDPGAGDPGAGDRRAGLLGPGPWRVDATVATRLLQIHMCIIYLFAGLGKLLGETWWDGTALWGAFANLEYQTLDMTWLVHHELVVNLMTQVVLAWEVSYCFLIWRPTLRPVLLALAVPLHMGIAVCMGMITFGLVMLLGNLAFVKPSEMRRVLEWLSRVGRPHPLKGG